MSKYAHTRRQISTPPPEIYSGGRSCAGGLSVQIMAVSGAARRKGLDEKKQMSTWLYGNSAWSSLGTCRKAFNRLLVWFRGCVRGLSVQKSTLNFPHWRPSCSTFISTVRRGTKQPSTSPPPSLVQTLPHRD